MATKENINWKRINMGDILPCQSFLRKKDGEILKLSTVGGVKVGQDCYYLPVDEVINVIKDYPVEESKDEEIINNIKKVIGWYRGMFTEKSLMPEQYQEIDAWLEKQGEQKPYGLREECKDCQCNYAGDCKGSCAMKRNEQKPVDKVEHKFKVGDVIRLKGSAAEYMIKKVTDTTYYTNGWSCGIERCEEDYELVEQKPWSKEDEVMLDEIIDFFENGTVKLQHDLSLYASWLKSLKDRVQPQSTWKPSDEQMASITCAVRQMKESPCYDSELVSLYNDLKKLKG